MEIVKRSELHRFVVLPKRWIVDRTLAWVGRCRRVANDFGRHARKAVAIIRLAMIRLILRRLTACASQISEGPIKAGDFCATALPPRA